MQLTAILADQERKYAGKLRDYVDRDCVITLDQNHKQIHEAFCGTAFLVIMTADQATAHSHRILDAHKAGRLAFLVIDEYHSQLEKLIFRPQAFESLPGLVRSVVRSNLHCPVALMSGSTSPAWVTSSGVRGIEELRN